MNTGVVLQIHMDALFLKGAILGFTMAAPVGPVGLLTIRTSMSRGRWYGQVMAAAVATGDALYGAVAAFGLTFISDPILHYKADIQFFGGMILLAMGIHIYQTKVGAKRKTVKHNSKIKIYWATLIFTLSNPSNIFSFAAAFAALNMATQKSNRLDASLIVAGVFIGSGLWFSVLSWLSAKYRHRISDKTMCRINQFAGVALMLFACVAMYFGYKGLFLQKGIL